MKSPWTWTALRRTDPGGALQAQTLFASEATSHQCGSHGEAPAADPEVQAHVPLQRMASRRFQFCL